MYKGAVAATITADQYDHPFKALIDSTVNMAELVFDFMYGTPERVTLTYIFALGLSFLGLGIEHAQSLSALRDCPVAGL